MYELSSTFQLMIWQRKTRVWKMNGLNVFSISQFTNEKNCRSIISNYAWSGLRINFYVCCLLWKTQLNQGIEDGYIFVKKLWCVCAAGDWTYRHGRKKNTLTTINGSTCFWILDSKSVIILGLCLVLTNDLFSSTFTWWF